MPSSPSAPVSSPFWRLIWATLLLIGFSVVAQAAPKRVALLIGNSQYQHEKFLPNPKNDVADLAVALRKLGFDVVVVENKGKIDMEVAINRFVERSNQASTALVFYAGHGALTRKEGQAFLLPVDAKVTDDATLQASGVSVADVLKRLEQTTNPAQLRLVVVDACRTVQSVQRGGDRGLGRAPMPSDQTLLAYSTSEGSPADDGIGRNSPYARSLIKHLPRLANERVLDVFDDVKKDVLKATDNKQRPEKFTQMDARVTLDGVEHFDPEAEAWKIADRSAQLQSYQAFIEKFPSSKYSPVAQIKIAAINADSEKPVKTSESQRATRAEYVGTKKVPCDQCPEIIYIPGGRYLMGSPETENKRSMSEGPQHTVNIDSIWIGVYEVTVSEWSKCASDGVCPRRELDHLGTRSPVVNVSWDDTQKFIGWLNKRSSMVCRLPSEAEWEYVARSTGSSVFSTGDRIQPNQANFDSSFTYNGSEKLIRKPEVVAVGSFPPNTLGVHDMHGNVREWVQDTWHRDYIGAPSDSRPWVDFGDPSRRIVRGGGWDSYPQFLRSAARDFSPAKSTSASLGFRIVCK